MAIRKLTPTVLDKVWGSPHTEPWFANPEGRKIGEIWFSAPEILPVLVKFLFTSDRLSVQVHPDDDYARTHHESSGKTEMWHILRAEPDAIVALGLREAALKKHVHDAALSGEIVDLLQWIPARPDDTFFVPAGTIHAIGGGLALCEIQQFSDVTYRLFDYQRIPERPLHLEDSLAVANLGPFDGRRQSASMECRYFRTERLTVNGAVQHSASVQPAICVAIAGEGTIAGEPFRAGDAWLILAGEPAFSMESEDAAFVIASYPS